MKTLQVTLAFLEELDPPAIATTEGSTSITPVPTFRRLRAAGRNDEDRSSERKLQSGTTVRFA